jgi:hypothetical protein
MKATLIEERLETLGITVRCASGELILEGTREPLPTEIRWISDHWQQLGQFALAAPASPEGPSELTWPKALTGLDRLSLTFWARLSPQERARSEIKPVHALERLMRVDPAHAAHLAGASPSSDAQTFPPQAELLP